MSKTTVTCPNGHESVATDYCDVCGEPMAQSAAASPPPPSAPSAAAPSAAATSILDLDAPTAAPVICKNCHAENLPASLFCEDCGYDFASGQLPPPATAPLPGPLPAAAKPVPPPAGTFAWVAEMWVDPDWFDAQGRDAAAACPPAGTPEIVAITGTTALIGKPSKSRNVNPDLDVSSDPGVSRQHARLTLASDTWTVEDLGSTNGTFVSTPGGPVADVPIAVGVKVPLGPNDRVNVGAWTKIVIRKAAAGEQVTR